jgi:hypothetical protein
MRRAKTRTKNLEVLKRMPILKREDQLPTDAEVVDSAVIVSVGGYLRPLAPVHCLLSP